MSKINKRAVSLMLSIALIISLIVAVAVALPQAPAVTQDAAPTAWDGSSGLEEIIFGNQNKGGNDHLAISYPSKMYLDMGESLESAGYYFKITSGHYGDGSEYSTKVSTKLWGYFDDGYQGMHSFINNYDYTVRNDEKGIEASRVGSVNADDSGSRFQSDGRELLLNVYNNPFDSRGDVYFRNTIYLKGTAKTVGTHYFSFNNNMGTAVHNIRWVDPWIGNSYWETGSTWTTDDTNGKTINVAVTIYDKSELRRLITELEGLRDRPAFRQTILDESIAIRDKREVTVKQVEDQTAIIREHVDAVKNYVKPTELISQLSTKAADLKEKMVTNRYYDAQGYKAITQDLQYAESIVNMDTPMESEVNKAISMVDEILGMWDEYYAKGYKILRGKIGDTGMTVTYLYPGTITVARDENLQDSGYKFVIDSDWHPESTDYRVFFDAGVWGWVRYQSSGTSNTIMGNIANNFDNFNYTATHAVGGGEYVNDNATFKEYGKDFQSDTFTDYDNIYFNNVYYSELNDVENRKAYFLEKGGWPEGNGGTYKTTIELQGTPKWVAQFDYNHTNMITMIEHWTPTTLWTERVKVSFDDTVSIHFNITESKAVLQSNLQTAINNLESKFKNAHGKVDEAYVTEAQGVLAKAKEMLGNADAKAADYTHWTTKVTEVADKEMPVDKGFDSAEYYCLEKDININLLHDNKSVTVNGTTYTDDDSDGIVTIKAVAGQTALTITYPDGGTETINIYNEHQGANCTETWDCTNCDATGLEAVGHNRTDEKRDEGDCWHKGTTSYRCDRCQQDFVETDEDFNYDIHALPAEYTWQYSEDATCATEGTRTATCGCGQSEITETAKNPDKHAVSAEVEWTYDETATCVTPGTRHAQCACGVETITEENVTNPAVHEVGENAEWTWLPGEEEKATCTVYGQQQATCGCGNGTVTREMNAADNHVNTHDDVTLAPTCTATGLKNIICDDCQQTIETGVEVAMLEHQFTWVEKVVKATCVSRAYTLYRCATCEATNKVEHGEIDPEGHSWERYGETHPATCMEASYQMAKCQRECGAEDKKLYEGEKDPKNHTETEWVKGDTVAPTCTTGGYTVYTHECGAEDNRDQVAALEHAWNDGEVTTAPTCMAEGVKTYTCTREGCGETKTETIPVDTENGHNWVEGEVVPPTCEDKGYTPYTCSICNNTKQENPVEATGHTLDMDNGVEQIPATCTTKGTTRYTCQNCDHYEDIQDIEINPDAHNYIEGEVVPPTCHTEGYTPWTCEYCGDVDKRDVTAIDPSLHDWVDTTEQTPATCTTPGEMNQECKNEACNVTQTREIPALGHAMETEGTVTSKPTCVVTGMKEYKCTREGCDHSTKEVIPMDDKNGHQWDEGTVVPPTCTEDGYTLHTCSLCRKTKQENPVEATDHKLDMENGVVQIPATCTTKGTTRYTCQNCDHYEDIQNIEINPDAHNYIKGEIVAPTCTADGYTPWTCEHCGKLDKRDIVTATGHHEGEGVIKTTATCEGKGEMSYSCTECDKELRTEEIEALGHIMDDGVVTKEPTETEAGEKTYSCTREGCEHTTTEVIPATGEGTIEPEEDSNLGAIIGGSVAGTAAVAGAGGTGAFFIIRKRRRG